MKNFKFTSFLLSLVGLFIISMFVTSCNKDEIISDEIEKQTDEELITITPELIANGVFLKAPKGFENKSTVEKHDYFEQLTEKEHEALQENYRISDYLESQGLLKDIEAKLKEGELLSVQQLNNILSANHIKELNKHKTNSSKGIVINCQLYSTSTCTLGRACPSDFLFDRAIYALVCGTTVYYGYFCNIYCT